jgi:hypothetical protein
MNRSFWYTSVTGRGRGSLSGFSLGSTLFDIGELGRRNVEEFPWLGNQQSPRNECCWTHGLAVGDGTPGMGVHGLNTNLEGSWRSAWFGVGEHTIGPSETFLRDVSEIGSLITTGY